MMKIGIIVLNYNTGRVIGDCLSSIEKLRKNDFKVFTYVIDNASQEKSYKEVLKGIGNLKIIENRKNLGFSGGNNVGIKKALEDGCDWVLILNPDTVADQNLLVEFYKIVKKDSQIGIVGPKIYFAKGNEFHKDRYTEKQLGKVIWYAGGKVDWKNILASHLGVDEVDEGQYDEIVETGFVSGAAMFIKKEVFEKTGFFNERYFLYLEDLEFCQRAKKKGFKVVFVPSAIIWHKNASSTKVGSSLQDYFITRNRLLFGMKFASLRTKIALLREALLFIFKNDVKRRAVFDFLTLNFGQGSFKIN